MTYTPVIEFCKQRISDLGATQLSGSPYQNVTAQPRQSDSDRRAVAELQMVITLCEGLNRIPQFTNEDKHS